MTVPDAAQENVPQIPYESVPDFLKLPPDIHLGEAAGVAVNSKGHIFVYSRSGSSLGPAYGNAASQLLEFTPEGDFLREIGKNPKTPHRNWNLIGDEALGSRTRSPK
jgi:hypothetical protein